MAYREVDMWEILEVLRRLQRGEANAAIERATGRTRRTIRRYKQRARKLGWEPGGEREPDEELAGAVAQSLRPVTEAEGLGAVEAKLMLHRSAISEWVSPADGSRGLRLSKVHDLLARQKVEVPYSSLHRFAVSYCGFRERQRVTVRVAEVAPGELAEVDFGRLGLVYDPDKGRRRVAWALLVTLGHSRHQYVHVTFTQTIADFIEGLEDAWEYFGGVPRRVVLDNLKAAVTKADRYDAIFQRTFDEYAAHRGFVIDAAVVRHPKGKPKVERNVQYLRESFFRGEQWIDLEHVRREVVRWCTEVAGKRIHGTTRQQPLAVFAAVEKSALGPLEGAKRFDPPTWQQCKVHPDHHFQFDKAIYCLPTEYIGRQLWIRADTKVVRAYCNGQLARSYQRLEPGGRYTDYDDYPKELTPYAMRDPQRMIRQAHEVGHHVGRFMAELLAGDFPWARLRQAQKLLRLVNKYGGDRVDGACRRALSFDLIHVGRVENIVRQSLEREVKPTDSKAKQLRLIPARFLRPAGSFTHQHPTQEETPKDGNQPITEDGPQAPEAVGDHGDAARPCRVLAETEDR